MISTLVRRAAALALAALALPVTAQDVGGAAVPLLDHPGGIHVVTLGPNGAECDTATELSVARELSVAGPSKVRLTTIPSSKAAGASGFRIILRATDQLLANPLALLAFRRSAARWEQIIQTDVTTVIDVDYGPLRFGTPYPSPNILGSTSSAIRGTSVTPEGLRDKLIARATDPGLIDLYNAIPIPTPSTSRSGSEVVFLDQMIGGTIPLQVLGELPPVLDASTASGVPTIGFNSSFTFDFDPRNGVANNAIDFEGVAIHEIGHALGFVSVIGNNLSTSQFTPWDLFRVRPEAVEPGEPLDDGAGWEVAERVVTPGPPNTVPIATIGNTTYFEAVQTTFTGDAEYETSTATGGGDLGDGRQASHWRDDALRLPSLGAERKIGIMDPNLSFGNRDEIEFPDIRLLELTGYSVDYEPDFADARYALNGTVLDTENTLVFTDELFLGDVPAGGTGTNVLTVENLDGDTPLTYDIEFELEGIYAEGTPVLNLVNAAGTVAPGAVAEVALDFASSSPAFVYGTLVLRSNDESQLVVLIPASFSVGGVTEPVLAATTSVDGVLGDVGRGQETYDLTLSNGGSFPLTYDLELLLEVDDIPFVIPEARRADPVVLFETDFESGAQLGGFTPIGPNADQWREVGGGPAASGAHSTPTAAHFGVDTETGVGYESLTSGTILSPLFEVAEFEIQDALTLTFNYYLDVGAGDVAEVVISPNDFSDVTAITSSNGGLLVADGTWRSVTVPIEGIAGASGFYRVGFRFSSDATGTATGFLVDDVVLASVEDAGFSASKLSGTVPPNGTDTVTITVDGGALPAGFYVGTAGFETNERSPLVEAQSVRFSVGGGVYPSLAETPVSPVLVVPGAPDNAVPFQIETRNVSTGGVLSYVRILEPALSNSEAPARTVGPAPQPAPLSLEATAPSGATPTARSAMADAVLPGALFPFAITQLGDGTLLIADLNTNSSRTQQIFVVSPDLTDIFAVPPPTGNDFVSGLAYDERTGNVWVAEFISGRIREAEVDDGELDYTGRQFVVDYSVTAMTYSAELDALLMTPNQSDQVFAYTTDGDVLPGYPFFLDNEFPNSIVALSFREGVVEITGEQNEIVQVDQFGRAFDGAEPVVFGPSELFGATRYLAYVRGRDGDADGLSYVVTDAGTDGTFRIVSIDPPDFPASVGTRIDAAGPMGSDQGVGPGEAVVLDFRIEPGVAIGATADDVVAFVVNDPTNPVVRFPIQIEGRQVAGEDGVDAAFGVAGAVPNPVRTGGAVRFTLDAAADVTVTVFNVLGQRVATLADGEPMTAGTHDLALGAESLAAGTYLVRVTAGDRTRTRTLTVVR
ncbi:NF038122 family metalloprotease [Rubrivirga sp. IMCC43871]|uniref:NF038122 family metalloprotease n=1 Tax=Rubrivirga sp. IMCC43871 TaxID=3391575 RepID=UPI00398FC34B